MARETAAAGAPRAAAAQLQGMDMILEQKRGGHGETRHAALQLFLQYLRSCDTRRRAPRHSGESWARDRLRCWLGAALACSSVPMDFGFGVVHIGHRRVRRPAGASQPRLLREED